MRSCSTRAVSGKGSALVTRTRSKPNAPASAIMASFSAAGSTGARGGSGRIGGVGRGLSVRQRGPRGVQQGRQRFGKQGGRAQRAGRVGAGVEQRAKDRARRVAPRGQETRQPIERI